MKKAIEKGYNYYLDYLKKFTDETINTFVLKEALKITAKAVEEEIENKWHKFGQEKSIEIKKLKKELKETEELQVIPLLESDRNEQLLKQISKLKKENEELKKCEHKGCNEKELIRICHNHINKDYPPEVDKIKQQTAKEIFEDISKIENEMIKSNYIWELWEREWKNAYRFYHTKGNIKTKSKLKDKWYKDFVKILEEVNLIIMNRK